MDIMSYILSWRGGGGFKGKMVNLHHKGRGGLKDINSINQKGGGGGDLMAKSITCTIRERDD